MLNLNEIKHIISIDVNKKLKKKKECVLSHCAAPCVSLRVLALCPTPLFKDLGIATLCHLQSTMPEITFAVDIQLLKGGGLADSSRDTSGLGAYIPWTRTQSHS